MSQESFHKLQNRLAEEIESLPADSRLPSEPILARKLGVSRATLREAMRSFEGQGRIRRRQGIGTFVIGKVPVLDSGLEILESIESLATRINLPVKMGALQIKTSPATEIEANVLGVTAGIPLTHVERVIYTDNRPIAYLEDILPQDIIIPQDLESREFRGSVLDLLLKRGNPKPTQSRTEIHAVGATPRVARALQVQRDDVLLQFIALLYGEDGRVMDFTYSFFLPGFFRFHVVRKVG